MLLSVDSWWMNLVEVALSVEKSSAYSSLYQDENIDSMVQIRYSYSFGKLEVRYSYVDNFVSALVSESWRLIFQLCVWYNVHPAITVFMLRYLYIYNIYILIYKKRISKHLSRPIVALFYHPLFINHLQRQPYIFFGMAVWYTISLTFTTFSSRSLKLKQINIW